LAARTEPAFRAVRALRALLADPGKPINRKAVDRGRGFRPSPGAPALPAQAPV